MLTLVLSVSHLLSLYPELMRTPDAACVGQPANLVLRASQRSGVAVWKEPWKWSGLQVQDAVLECSSERAFSNAITNDCGRQLLPLLDNTGGNYPLKWENQLLFCNCTQHWSYFCLMKQSRKTLLSLVDNSLLKLENSLCVSILFLRCSSSNASGTWFCVCFFFIFVFVFISFQSLLKTPFYFSRLFLNRTTKILM